MDSNNDSISGSDGRFSSSAELVAVVTSREFLGSLSKHEIEAIVTAASKERKRRFRRNKERKYGNICKGFTEQELQTFLRCCLNPKAKMAFQIMANLGLRVGEAERVRLQEVDLSRRKLLLFTEKAHTGDSLYLHDEVQEQLRAWIEAHYDAITAHQGFLLYSEVSCNKEQHISPHWLRNEFRKTTVLAGLNETYGYSDEPAKASRRLHRLSTHSLRHYFITKVYKATKDPIVAQKLARHTDIQSTQVYIHTAQTDLDGSLSKAFDRAAMDREREQTELRKLAELWRLVR